MSVRHSHSSRSIAFSPAYAVNVITHSALAYPPFPLEQAQLYNTNRTGILTNPGGDILGFEKLPEGYVSPAIRAELDALSPDWPDVEHLFLDGYFGYANDSSGAPTDGRNYVSSSCALTNPFSRGNVTISSPNTEDYPVVNPNWLLDPRDQEVAVAAFKRAREVLTQPQTQSVLIGEEVFPGLNTSSDDQILNLIAQSAASSYHASCTCAMGMANDSMAVLDSKARVLGVQRLRVIDASAFPVLPPGHPSSTVCKFNDFMSTVRRRCSCMCRRARGKAGGRHHVWSLRHFGAGEMNILMVVVRKSHRQEVHIGGQKNLCV